MATTKNLSELRNILWSSTFLSVQTPSYVSRDDYRHGYARCAYERAKREAEIDEQKRAQSRRSFQLLRRALITDSNDRSPYQDLVFSIGLLLLAYGNLDVLENVLDNVPTQFDNFFFKFDTVLMLLPLPDGLYEPHTWFEEGPSRVREWYLEHHQRLTWNEEQGKFVLLSE